MFTQCPHCNTVFRINAAQLTQARGQVRCGICDSSFNSLEHLSESLASFAEPTGTAHGINTPVEQVEDTEDETHAIEIDTEIADAEALEELTAPQSMQEQPEFEEEDFEEESHAIEIDTEFDDSQALEEFTATPSTQETPEFEEEVFEEETHPIEIDTEIEDSEVLEELTAPPSAQEQPESVEESPENKLPPLTPPTPERVGFMAPRETTSATTQTSEHDDEVPAFRILPDKESETSSGDKIEEKKEAAKSPPNQVDSNLPDLGIIAVEPRRISSADMSGGWLKTTVWSITNIALILVFLGQYIYFNRNDLSQYPELRPWLTGFCELVSCNTPLQRDVSHIDLANRVVQSDPNHANALLINATLVNDADFPQPFPLLEIRFSDLNNRLVAGRRFRPTEYLPADTSVQAGMPPHQPVHITLEVVDPGKDAVGFQFDLL